MIRKLLFSVMFAAMAVTYLAAPCYALVAAPKVWFDFDNQEGQTAATYDGLITDQGGIGLDLFVNQFNGVGGQPILGFQAGQSTNPPPEHYVTSGATFSGAGTAYHMEGGTHRTYDDGAGFPDFDPNLDPRTANVLFSANDIFSRRDQLGFDPPGAAGQLDSSGSQGSITYAFWLNIKAATKSMDSTRFFSDTSFLIGRGSGGANGFSGEVSVRKVAGGLFNPVFALQVRNDLLFDGTGAPSGIQNSDALGITTLKDEWHHYVVQYDLTGATGSVAMWQDGGTANGGTQGTLTGLGTKQITGNFLLNQVAHPGAGQKETGDFLVDDFGVWTGTTLTNADVTAIFTNGIGASVDPPPVFDPADTDKDGDVDTADLTTMFQNFTGAVGAAGGKNMFDGDTDMDGDVDTADLTIGFQNFTGALAGLANNPDLIYDPTTGNVKIDADGANVLVFNLQSGAQFNPPADFTDLDNDVTFASAFTDNTATAIGWTSALALANLGFDGPAGGVNTPLADLGNILPTGLDLAGLTALLTNKAWGGANAAGGDFDLVVSQVPEPGSLVLLALGMLGLLCLRLRRSR